MQEAADWCFSLTSMLLSLKKKSYICMSIFSSHVFASFGVLYSIYVHFLYSEKNVFSNIIKIKSDVFETKVHVLKEYE